jgi:hypothetical protein
VGSSAIQRFLARHGKIGLDTSIFIYQVEGHPKYVDLTGTIFAWLESPDGRAVTSTVTMLELLVQPYRLSDFDRVNQLYLRLSRLRPAVLSGPGSRWGNGPHVFREPGRLAILRGFLAQSSLDK